MYKILTIVGSVILALPLYAQTQAETEMSFTRKPDNTIEIKIVVVDTEEYDPVPGLNLEVYSVLDTLSKKLGSTTTDEQGIAVFQGSSFQELLLNEGHQFAIEVKSENAQYTLISNSLEGREVIFEITFQEVDSVKKIVGAVKTWDETGAQLPVEEAEIYLFVPRLFGLLPIGELYTDEEGEDMVNFPTDLPGDKTGAIVVQAKIEEHESFGTVWVQNQSNWGLPANGTASELPRALWSSRPPLWMIIAFVVLMGGVWGHYGWVVVNLSSIKKNRPKDQDLLLED